MSRKFLPFAIMILMLVLALGALGVGYGLWFENLTLEGTVNTGTVDVEWSGPYEADGTTIGWDECVHMPDGACSPEGTNGAKDIADCLPEINGNTFSILVTNAYPSYQCSFGFDIHSTGTIPVHLAVREDSPAPAWMDDPDSKFDCTFIDAAGAETHIGSLADLYSTTNPVQLHPGDKVFCTLVIHFDNDDVDKSGHTFSFEYTIQAHQYNEDTNLFP